MWKVDCHIHMVLDGVDWKAAIRRHEAAPMQGQIRQILKRYAALGYTYLRDGGDRWGVGAMAREMSKEFEITYKTPLAPLCKQGHYGKFIGKTFENTAHFSQLVAQQRAQGADFIKIMISGLMDFDRFGVLTEEGLAPDLIRQLVHIAHEEGMAVMAHGNGARTVQAAAEAGVDSIEHGAYLDEVALAAMKEAGTVWVPTLSAIGNLRGKGRFDQYAVERILDSAMENVARFAAIGGLLAPGSDAGAWAVEHGCQTEDALMAQALGENGQAVLEKGILKIQEKF